jgi:predicted small lipoprotein YifL
MRDHLALAILLCTLTLAACGTRGSLTMPPPAKPVAGSASAPTAALDINTTKELAR